MILSSTRSLIDDNEFSKVVNRLGPLDFLIVRELKSTMAASDWGLA